MPQESYTPVERGEGSVSADFNAPQQGVATPGRQLSPGVTQEQNFRDAVLSFGAGVANAVSARAAINTRLKALKENSVKEVFHDLQSSALAFQQRRLESADATRQQILVDAEEYGMEWAEREFRSRMVNAGSVEEARLWESAWQGAASEVSRENEEAKQQAFNRAKMTMNEVTLQLSEQLAEDPALRATLQGDGTQITSRVQDWMLTELQQSVDLETLTQEDAELLIHQTIVQSSRLADDLRNQHQKMVEDSNLRLGTRQITSDVASTAVGDQNPANLRRQIEITLRDRMSHLTIEQQESFVREQVSDALINIANGSMGIAAADAVARASDFLNLNVHGEPVFNATEKQAITAEIMRVGQNTIVREAQAAVAALKEKTRQPITGFGFDIASMPNPAAEAALLVPDENGRNAYDREGDRILREQGLLNLSNPTPEQSLLISAVRQTMEREKATATNDAAKQQENMANWVSVMTGSTGDGNKAYSTNPFTRAKMGPAELKANKLEPLSMDEIRFAKMGMKQVAVTPEEQAALSNWNGQPVPYTEENRVLHRLMAKTEARQWQEGEIQAVTGMPSRLVDEKLSLLKSNDPLRVEAFSQWAGSLDVGAGEGWTNFVDSVGPNEAAAAAWLRVHARLGQANSPTAAAADPMDLMDQVQTILNAPDVNQWMGTDTGTEDAQVRYTNTRNMAEVLTKIIAEENPGVDFNEDGNMLAQMQSMIVGDRGGVGRQIRQLWFAGRAANPTLNDEQVGQMLYRWMRADKYRVRSVNDRMVFIRDPIGYTGEEGGDIDAHVQSNFHRQFTPEYRSFLQEAMGVKPVDVPHNLAGLIASGSDAQGLEDPGAIIPTFSLREQSASRMLESRADYGGFVVGGQIYQGGAPGTLLNNIVSKNDATLTWPDGSSVFVPKGTVLNVLNPDLFAPVFEQPFSGFLPGASGPVVTGFSRPVSSIAPSGARLNIPQE